MRVEMVCGAMAVDGLGRYIPRVQRVNEQVDISIIVATGPYTPGEIPHFFYCRGRARSWTGRS
jgi:phosphotriesterase-related protein